MNTENGKKTYQDSQTEHCVQHVNNDTTNNIALEDNSSELTDKKLYIASDKIGHDQENESSITSNIDRNHKIKDKKLGKCDNHGVSESKNSDSDASKKKLSCKYKKRAGTSAITGSLYKTKILSLILYRSLHDEEINDFVLGCSVDSIGSMSDICFRFKTNTGKPAVVFMKIKYTENPKKQKITTDDFNNEKSPFNLLNCFQSFTRIKERFNDNNDPLFEGKFDDIDQYYIVYTPHHSKIDDQDIDKEIFTDKVYKTINATGETKSIFKVKSTVLYEELKKERIRHMGKTIADYVTADNDSSEEITEAFEEIIEKYFHYLIPNVLVVNEQNGVNVGVFNDSLYNSSDEEHILLKNVLFNEILLNTKPDVEEAKKNLYLLLERKICKSGHISYLIGNVIAYDDKSNKLVFTDKTCDQVPDFMKEKLNSLDVTKSIADEAMDLAGRRTLNSIQIDFNKSNLKQIIDLNSNNQHIISRRYFEDEENMSKQFLNSLYFYTEQGKEDEVGIKLQEEIAEKLVMERSEIFKGTPELVSLKFHHKVQKWWLQQYESDYQTNSCNFWNDVTNVIDSAHLSFLDFKCRYELDQFQLKFKPQSTRDNLSNLVDHHAIANIVSDSVILTGIKLSQYLETINSLFLDFKHITNIKAIEFNAMLEEMESTSINHLVIIYTSEMNEFDKLKQIVDKFCKHTVIVSNQKLTDGEAFQKSFVILNDDLKLADIENVNDIIKYQITVQGIADELDKFIKDNNLINPGIIEKILKNERIEIGTTLSNPSYEELEKYYVERKIRNDEFEHTQSTFSATSSIMEYPLSTFKDMDDKVVIITAKPGMGKSTLLTHLSVKTKSLYPQTWIVRMNLQDYSEEFDSWNNTNIVFEDCMRLVCKGQFSEEVLDKFSFGIVDGELTLEKVDLEGIELLHLLLFINSFNNGNMIFLFDGFDEICPYYETIVVQFMQELQSINPHQIWITSRPYNAIKRTLTNQFNSPYYLRRLSTKKQNIYYQNYWEAHLQFDELNSQQLKNVDAFFEFMTQYRQQRSKLFKVPTSSSVPLRLMHEAAVDFFRAKVMNSTIEDKESLLQKWITKQDLQTVDNCNMTDIQYEEALHLAGIPLQMHIYANYFISEITDTSTNKNWETGVHSSRFYESFLETKFKTRFEEKNREEFYSAVNSEEYIEEKEKFRNMHKMLAFYTFFHDSPVNHKKVLPKETWQTMINMIAKVQKGKEKTGLIDRIYRGVPRFVHLVFAEYFAIEYIADMLAKNDSREMIDFIINCLLRSSVGLMTLFDQKLKNDAAMRSILSTDGARNHIFTIWMEQNFTSPDGSILDSSIVKALENNLIEISWVILRSIKGNINKENVDSFVRYTARDLCVLALDVGVDEKITYMLDVIRDVDVSMIDKVTSDCGLHKVESSTNEEILKLLHEKQDTVVPFEVDFSVLDGVEF